MAKQSKISVDVDDKPRLTESQERRLNEIGFLVSVPVLVNGKPRVIESRYTRGEFERRIKLPSVVSGNVKDGVDVSGGVVYDLAEFKPFPKQVYFLAYDYDEVLYGGARGGGKSACMIVDAACHARRIVEMGDGSLVVDKMSIDYPEYTAIILRRTYADLVRNFKPMCDRIYPKLGGVWREKTQSYQFPSGATISLGYCDSDDDINKYIGGNFTYLGIEEVNMFPWRWVNQIGSSVRSTNPELKPLKRYTTNPGGVGHNWIKKRFIDPCPPVEVETRRNVDFDVEYVERIPGEPFVDEHGVTRWFIPASVFDNPALVQNDKTYVNNLKSMDSVKRKQWLHGDWDEQSGTFFADYNPLIHVMDVRDFKIDPQNCRIYRGVDYGTTNPFACCFVQVDKKGRAVVFDEIYMTGTTPRVQADLIMQKTRQWGLTEDDIYMTVVDPAMKVLKHESGNTLKSEIMFYEEAGMKYILPGNNSRIQGWSVFKEYLRVPDADENGDSIPYLRFTSNCEVCLDTMPEQVQSKKNADDIDTDGEDHMVDAIRYLLMFLNAPTAKRTQNDDSPKWLRDLQMRQADRNKASNKPIWTL